MNRKKVKKFQVAGSPSKKKETTPMSFTEVKSCSEKYILPSKVIYELYSEFNCLKALAVDLEKKE